MITILLMLAALPVKGMHIQNTYDYREPNQSLNPASDRSSAVGETDEPEVFGANTARAVLMKPRGMTTSGLGRLMMNEMEIMTDFFGPALDQPISKMVDTIMHSTPQEIMHGIIDPIMSSPKSQETLGELDRQFAEFITNQLGDDLLNTLDNEFLGGNTISSLVDYATGELPRITAFQFAAQLMIQFQVQFAEMMDVMSTTTFGEMVEPIVNMFAKIPDMTPSEAAQMIAEPIMSNEVNLGSLDESIASFIQGLQTSPSGSSRPSNREASRSSDTSRPSSDNFNSEQADFARLGGASQNTNPQITNLNGQAVPDQGSGRFQERNNQQPSGQGINGFQGGNGQHPSGQRPHELPGVNGQRISGGFQPSSYGQQGSGGFGLGTVQQAASASGPFSNVQQTSGGFQPGTSQQPLGIRQGGVTGGIAQQPSGQRPNGFPGNAGQHSANQFGQHQNGGSNFADLQQQGFDITDPYAEPSQTSGRDTGSQQSRQQPGNSNFPQPGNTGSRQPSQPRNTGFQQPRQQPINSGFPQSGNNGVRQPSQPGNNDFQQFVQTNTGVQQPFLQPVNSGFPQSGNTGFRQPSQPGNNDFQQFVQTNTGVQQPVNSGFPQSDNTGSRQSSQPRNTGFQQPSQPGNDFQQPSQTNNGFQSIINPIMNSLGSGLNQVNRFFGNSPDQSGNQVGAGTNANTRSSSVSGGRPSNQNAGQYSYSEPEQRFNMRA